MSNLATEETMDSASSQSGSVQASSAFSDENNIDDMYLTFGVAREEYGVAIAYVTEIVGMHRVMPVPDVPNYIKGVINLRGKVIPVMDVRLRFKMPEEAYSERTVIIVLDVERVPVGLVVDDVRDVLEIPAANIDPAPQFGASREASNIVRGLGKSDDRVAIILDIHKLITEDVSAGQISGAAVQ